MTRPTRMGMSLITFVFGAGQVGKKKTTTGLKADQLVQLLDIGAEDMGPEPDVDRARGDLLRLRLAGTLPVRAEMAKELPAIVTRLCKELLPLQGKSLGDVLLDRHTPLNVLETIKDFGKKASAQKDRKAEHDVAIAIYYAALAAAVLFYDRKITKWSYGHLAKAFDSLIGKAWMADDLVDLLSKAKEACEMNA